MHQVESSLFLGTVLFCGFIQRMCFEHLLCQAPCWAQRGKDSPSIRRLRAHSCDGIDSGKETGRGWRSSWRWKDSVRQWRLILWELCSEQGRPARPVSAGGFESAARSPGVPDGWPAAGTAMQAGWAPGRAWEPR